MAVSVDIEKRVGDFHLKVKLGAGNEVLALLGASGCGKSMTLRCIAGIERPDRGRIEVDGVTLFDSEKRIDLTPQRRRTGLMFQNYALFPNMTVLQNIRCGTRREPDKEKRRRMVDALMESFDLTALADHYPSQLSGGQQQRTALARILVSDPRILLLDEPFSALDSHLRFRLERRLREVIREFGRSVVLVSHDRDEVFRLSDKIAVMSGGRVECFGPRSEVFRDPETRTAALLTGCKNISRAASSGPSRVRAEDWGVELDTLPVPPGTAFAGVRMHDIAAGEGENTLRCAVMEEIENPFSFTVMLRPLSATGGEPLGWELDKPLWASLRAPEVTVHIPKEKINLLKGD